MAHRLPVSAGQEAGKPALPKRVGGIVDRRSETRHPYISIIPSLNCQDGCVCQRSGEHKRLELNNVQEETSSRSRPLVQLRSCLWDEILLKNTATGEPVCQTNLSRILETSALPVSLASYEVESNQITGNIQNPDKNSEHVTEHASGESNDLNGHNGIAFVNIDSYEPDSSDGEDDDGQDQLCLGREEAGVFQEALDDVVSELGKGIEAFTDLESQLSTLSRRISRECCKEVRPVPLTRYLSIDSDMNHSNNKTLKKSPAEGQAIPKSNLTHETQQVNLVDTEICTPVTTYNELNLSDDEAEQGNPPELAVRPKIRKQNPTSRLERETHLSDDEESESTPNRGSETAKIQQGYDKRTWRNDKEELSFAAFLKSKKYTDSQKNTSTDLSRNTTAQEQNDDLNNSNFWDALECCSRHLPQPLKDEDSSECSDGEWSASGPLCFAAAVKSLSDESWGTLPGREEHEPEEGNSGIEVYIGSGLGGRLLDEFNEGLGAAQAISSVDPQFITYVALEERLAQAMENALAHLESLAVDDQQAHPPAPKESIDCLPQIIITDDRNGQDQCCCTICFSEYVKDEIITELPCHHLFHKLCVTLWLQKSGTCPICRNVLAPVHP
ncbi:E3 ubiquitin-protein ligase Praja-2 [Aythya fuligula]|uniref:RING-type E3 ubiquitin transferase n=1 Tax=Aythya fuligula TaxID=219594 RepID=A0A6J3EDW8_AYTFU|nr:E3 ubiquitin-protein ligase Praja-2 [Aythya fuligula]